MAVGPYGIEKFVEFGSRHRFSCFGDIQIAGAKGEFDQITNLRADQNRRSSPEGGSEIGIVRPLILGNILSGTRIKNW
jgi:hypothetical protein